MGNLMTDTYTYEDLANTYGNFYLPAVKVFINETDVIRSMSLALEDISIVLSLSAASSTVLKFGNVYDKESRSFLSGLTDKFKPGTIVEIAIGYYSAVQTVMKGFVYLTGAEFGEKISFVVTVMDVKKLMMISGVKHLMHDAANYSDVFETVMASYSGLCTAETKATSDELEKPISQTSTDYNLIVDELVGKSSREFLVVAGKAYFRERPKTGSAILQLEFGRELLRLEMDYSYLDVSVQVTGYNRFEQTVYTGTAAAASAESQTTLITPSPAATLSDPDADSQEKVTLRAEYLAEQEIENAKYGKGITIGLPELVPGRFVEVVGLEEMANRKYYMKEVRHTIREGYFTTEFDIGGWI